MNIIFLSLVSKYLSIEDINYIKNNEFNSGIYLEKIFGYDKRYINAKFHYIDNYKKLQEKGEVIWCDISSQNAKCVEYRLKYSDTNIIKNANEGDLLIIGVNKFGIVEILIISKDSNLFENISSILYSDEQENNKYILKNNISIDIHV